VREERHVGRSREEDRKRVGRGEEVTYERMSFGSLAAR